MLRESPPPLFPGVFHPSAHTEVICGWLSMEYQERPSLPSPNDLQFSESWADSINWLSSQWQNSKWTELSKNIATGPQSKHCLSFHPSSPKAILTQLLSMWMTWMPHLYPFPGPPPSVPDLSFPLHGMGTLPSMVISPAIFHRLARERTGWPSSLDCCLPYFGLFLFDCS